jgi:hypothetical protein
MRNPIKQLQDWYERRQRRERLFQHALYELLRSMTIELRLGHREEAHYQAARNEELFRVLELTLGLQPSHPDMHYRPGRRWRDF